MFDFTFMFSSYGSIVNIVLLIWKFGFLAAKQARSPSDVVSKLVEFGLSSSSETQAFSEEIFLRVPRKAAGLNVSYLL